MWYNNSGDIMSETKKTKNKKRKLSRAALIIICGIIIILIPCLILGGILLSAALQTGNPIFGDRYKGDLEPAITETNMENIEKSVSSISGVEKCDAVLTSGQLRINVDTKDSLSSEEIETLVDEVYAKVKSELPIGTYFTSGNGKKMYDLAINVYNFIKKDDESMIYYILNKNAMMDGESIQCVSEPLDADLAAELRGENIVTEDPEAGSNQNDLE